MDEMQEIMEQVAKSDLCSTKRFVMFAICVAARDSDGVFCEPLSALAGYTGLTKRTLSNHLPGLVSSGWLSSESRQGYVTIYTPQIPSSEPGTRRQSRRPEDRAAHRTRKPW